MSRCGDPLSLGIEIAAMPILRPNVLPELAKVLSMNRENAAEVVAGRLRCQLAFLPSAPGHTDREASGIARRRACAAAVVLCRGRGARASGAHPKPTAAARGRSLEIRRLCVPRALAPGHPRSLLRSWQRSHEASARRCCALSEEVGGLPGPDQPQRFGRGLRWRFGHWLRRRPGRS
jgi:hypothetical protein